VVFGVQLLSAGGRRPGRPLCAACLRFRRRQAATGRGWRPPAVADAAALPTPQGGRDRPGRRTAAGPPWSTGQTL